MDLWGGFSFHTCAVGKAKGLKEGVQITVTHRAENSSNSSDKNSNPEDRDVQVTEPKKGILYKAKCVGYW